MRFTDVQQKEVIDVMSGKFIGFIIDAEVNKQSGYIELFHVATEKKVPYFSAREPAVLKIKVTDIVTIGKDVILVHLNQ